VYTAEGRKASTLDLCGKGRFTLLTGIGGEAWRAAAEAVAAEFGIALTVHVIGPRCEWLDYSGDWARAREITDSGALLVRPDQHVAWRAGQVSTDAAGQLRAAMLAILGK